LGTTPSYLSQIVRRLRLGSRVVLDVRALGEFQGSLLEGGELHAAPLRQQAHICIAAERSLMADLTQKLAYGGMILKMPVLQVQW
jgi:hypothetical protein